MDKVKDVVVERNGPMSPYSKHPVFIDEREWDSVLDFVQQGSGTLERGMLSYFCQNLHLQRPLRDSSAMFYFEGFDKDERQEVMRCYDYLREQFGPLDDFDETFGFVNMHEREHREDVRLFFDLCQPFLGKDQALVVTHAWLNKRLYKSVYDEPIERLLRSFPGIE